MREHMNPSREFIRRYRGDEHVRRLTFEAGSQLIQLVLAEVVWDRLDQARLRAALREIVEGPDLSDHPDDQPRSTLLELVTAADLADHGFIVNLTKSKEDVALACPDVGPGAAECKRPVHLESILSNLQKIGQQLRQREKAGSRFGVAVVGADRIAHFHRQMYEAADVDEVNAATAALTEALGKRVDEAIEDTTSNLVPSAAFMTIVLTGSVLIREPFHLRPLVVIARRQLVEDAAVPPPLRNHMYGPTRKLLARFEM